MLETRSLLLIRAVLLLASASLCLSQITETICNNGSLTNCDSCINAAPQCSWCPIMPEEHERLIRTANYSGYENIRCRDESSFPVPCNDLDPSVLHNTFQNPQTVIDKIMDVPLSTSVQENVTVQVRPQNVTMKLRRGDTESFLMEFVSLRNTPLDVYFLVDVSSSLSGILNALRNDVIVIARGLQNISTAYAIGFGSYVDKRTLPYSHESLLRYNDANRNVTSCRAFTDCEPSYVYHHSINFTQNITQFNETFAHVSILSGNLDAPESSMDALVQAALCSEVIGWRPTALRMVFVVTDNLFHIAGDGKFAGLVQPNQGRCNLAPIPNNQFNEYEYTRETKEDYVSMWQIRRALEENQIVPTFVIQFHSQSRRNETALRTFNSFKAFTEQLTTIQPQVFLFDLFEEVGGINVTEQLINVIQEAYENTVQVVNVGVPKVPGFRFNITPVDCRREDSTLEGACRVDFDETVTFNVSVTLEDCTIAPKERISVQLRGGAYQFTHVDVEAQCACPCSQPNNTIIDDSVCTMGNGDLVCGVCVCDAEKMYTGPECQCPPPAEDRTFFCTDNSQCSDFPCDACGNCLCNNTSFGDDCSCDIMDNTCEFGTNPLTGARQHCSGPERGDCICERQRCDCKRAPLSEVRYFRTAANQDTDDNNCECDPDDCFSQEFPGGLCFNRDPQDGTSPDYHPEFCRCGGCQCPTPLFTFRKTCTSLDLLCTGLQECVQCFLDRRDCSPGDICQIMDCHEACSNHTFIQQPSDEEPHITTPEGYQDRCQFTNTEGCVVDFFFSTDDALPVIIENDGDFSCPASTIPWIIAGSLVGAILVLGLLALIILKICLVFLERMEYRKFTQELKEADFAPHENPLYITPQQDYQNPIRRSSTRRSQ